MRTGKCPPYAMCCRAAGVRETGAAAADPDRRTLTLIISGGNEPRGVFSFHSESLHRSVNASNATLSLTVNRRAGTIGEFPNTFQGGVQDFSLGRRPKGRKSRPKAESGVDQQAPSPPARRSGGAQSLNNGAPTAQGFPLFSALRVASLDT